MCAAIDEQADDVGELCGDGARDRRISRWVHSQPVRILSQPTQSVQIFYYCL